MSENNTIPWSKDVLAWSDFKAESHPGTFEDACSTIRYRYVWTVNSEKIENKIIFFIQDIQIIAEFHPLLSWVRTLQASDHLLKHEQGHFDLAEIIKRENQEILQDKFSKKQYPTRGQNEQQQKQFAKEDSGKMISQEIQKLEVQLLQRRHDYNIQTEYGQNLIKQAEYDLLFNQLRA